MTGPVVYVGPGQYQAFARRHAASYGLAHKLLDRKKSVYDLGNELKAASFVWVWNGLQANSPTVVSLCRRRGIPHAFLEWGMLPQAETFFVDPQGFCGRSVLGDSLSWVTRADMDRLEQTRAQLRRDYPEGDDGYVLVPYQIENDTQVLHHTPFDTMDDLRDHLLSLFPGQRFVFRPHPKSPVRRGLAPKDRARASVDGAGEWMAACAKASAVVGLTSTCLLEAAVYGKPVLALGDCALRRHGPKHRDRVAAGALALRVRREGKGADPSAVLERFGVRPLGCEPVRGVA